MTLPDFPGAFYVVAVIAILITGIAKGGFGQGRLRARHCEFGTDRQPDIGETAERDISDRLCVGIGYDALHQGLDQGVEEA